MARGQQIGQVLEQMVQYTNNNPSWEKSASLLFLLGVFFGCTSIFNRFLFSMGADFAESLFLFEILFPSVVLVLVMLLGLDRWAGYPINLSQFFNKQALFTVLPSAILFSIRNTLPAYAMALSQKGNVRDFVFCSRLVQPILIFVLEACFTTRQVWRWHVVCLFILISGISLFLFHTFDPSVAASAIPLMGSQSNPFATVMNLISVASGGCFFVLFARVSSTTTSSGLGGASSSSPSSSSAIPLQDLISFHFLAALVLQVVSSLITGTLKSDISALFNTDDEMQERLVISAILNACMLALRMVCLAKTSCVLTALVPIYFVIPIRLLMGAPLNGTGILGVALASVGMISYLIVSFSEFSGRGTRHVSWVQHILNLNQHQMATRILVCCTALYGVSLFSAVFPIVCKVFFGLATSYIVWSLVLVCLPLILLTYEGVGRRKSVVALYLALGILMFSFLPLQFGPIQTGAACVCFILEVCIVYLVGGGLDALQMSNGIRPGNRAANVFAKMTEMDLEHDAELDHVVDQFIVGDDDDEEDGL